MVFKKNWWKSKTIIACIVTFVITIMGAMFGEANIYVTMAVSVASAFGVYGRYTATESISKL